MPYEGSVAPASAFLQPTPKSSTETRPSRDETNRRKSSSKSRNGCITCKGRRIKCDETKPACNQCTRRRFTCGGYRKDIRFRNIIRPIAARSQNAQRDSPSYQYVREVHPVVSARALVKERETACSRRASSPNILSWPFATADSAFTFDFTNSHTEYSWVGPHADPCFAEAELVNLHPSTSQELPDEISGADGGADGSFLPGFDTLLTSPFSSPSVRLPDLVSDRSPEIEDDPLESLAMLFHKETCRYLSLRDNTDENPWSKYVWPMTRTSKALFHAIIGMTWMLRGLTSSSAQEKVLLHFQESKSLFDEEITDGSMRMESALATTVVTGFVEAWGCGDFTTHANVENARRLMRKSLTRIAPALPLTTTSPCLNFLLNACIYLDVMARLTSTCGTLLHSDLDQVAFPEPYADGNEMDPLMGYAMTLFPIIGRVADLVGEIRARISKRNSPAIIARAIELRKTIEIWAPAIGLAQVDDPTANMSDAIQTAEAYRWSTLLLLQQAVPELPNLGSVGELGQRTLVYLATIPITSQTIIAHTYPLMVAGTEAIDEDREFVRKRWQCMSERMGRRILNGCVKITEEVWKRRDAYLTRLDISMQKEISRTWLSIRIAGSQYTDQESMTQHNSDYGSDPQSFPNSLASRRSSFASNHFPISAAFREGVDPLTRSGNVEYTVKGRLHWLGVLEDWGHEIFLG